MTSKILRTNQLRAWYLWAGEGKLTTRFPPTSDKTSYLLISGKRAATITISNATTAVITSLNDNNVVIEPTGNDWEFEIRGLEYYCSSFLISM